MLHDEGLAKMIWIFIFAVFLMVFSCLMFRFVLLFLLDNNVCNLHTLFSNTRILQTNEEKKICNKVARQLKRTFKASNTCRIVPIQPHFMAFNISNNDNQLGSTNVVNHWPVFQIAIDGKILNPDLLIATKAPDYSTIADSMFSTNYFCDSSLDANTSLNMRNSTQNSFSISNYGGFHANDDHVPIDRPLFVNTSMSAQQNADLYRRLSFPPRNDERALAIYNTFSRIQI